MFFTDQQAPVPLLTQNCLLKVGSLLIILININNNDNMIIKYFIKQPDTSTTCCKLERIRINTHGSRVFFYFYQELPCLCNRCRRNCMLIACIGKIMTLWRQSYSRVLSLDTLRHAPLRVHRQNAALIIVYRLGRQNVEASVITTHEVTEMDNHVGLFMAFNTVLVHTFYTCNALQHQWLMLMATAFCCCSHLALPSLQLAPNPPLPPFRVQPGQRLLNNIPQLVKPHQSQGWQESSMESRYLSHSNADDLDNLGVSLSNVE